MKKITPPAGTQKRLAVNAGHLGSLLLQAYRSGDDLADTVGISDGRRFVAHCRAALERPRVRLESPEEVAPVAGVSSSWT